MVAEGENPTPQVQRLQDTLPRCTYTVDFYAALRSPSWHKKMLRQPLGTHQLYHKRPPPSLLPRTRPWLSNRDLRWQQQQVQQLLLEERQQLLHDSHLMGPDSLLAAYTYEHITFSTRQPETGAAQATMDEPPMQHNAGSAPEDAAVSAPQETPTAAVAAAAASDLGAASSRSPGGWSTASTRCSKVILNGEFSGTEGSPSPRKACCKSTSSINSSEGSKTGHSSAAQALAQHRARLFVRKERLTAKEIFAAVRCITDPEHPYTLEQLMVVVPEYVKVHCRGCSSTVSAAAAEGSTCHCLQQQDQQKQKGQLLQHWALMRGLHIEIGFRPTIPHCSQATLIGLLLLVKAQRAAAAAVAAGTAAVDVSIFPGAHASYASINKQLRDKERVRAAAANPSLKQMIDSGKYTHPKTLTLISIRRTREAAQPIPNS